MAEKRARLAIARAAARLAAVRALPLPSLVLMTDDDRLADPCAAAAALPRGSMVIVRGRDPVAHRAQAEAMMRIARMRHLLVLIAGDAALAARFDADGLHLPEVRAKEAWHWRALHPRWLITAASHGAAPVPDAVDAVFLSPIFATQSHAGRAALGVTRAALIAARLTKPVYALGGINPVNAAALGNALVGIAAIGGLSV